jgi:ABC-type sugar transport system permease subunit
MWIADPNYSIIAIIIVAAWVSVGYLMIIYMAALQAYPQHEGSSGAGRRKRLAALWQVEFPIFATR